MAWLRSHLDLLAGRPACRIHGDVGFHNILMNGDEIGALLDWEFSHISDPIEDLVYIKPFLDQISGWDDFLKVYQDASGFTFEADAAPKVRLASTHVSALEYCSMADLRAHAVDADA